MGDLTLGSDRFGNNGQAYSFDGSGDYIALPDSGAIADLDRRLTFAAWVHPEAYGDGWMTVFVHDQHWHVRLEDGGVNAWGYQSDAPDVSSQDVALAGTWSHIAFTYDGSHLRVYLNGKISGETAFESSRIGSSYGATGPTLGKGPSDNWDEFHGLMDDVRFYDRALRAEEIARLPGLPRLCAGLREAPQRLG